MTLLQNALISLPFKGRVGEGMGSSRQVSLIPIPLPTSPLKGEESLRLEEAR